MTINKMNIISQKGDFELAKVYVASFRSDPELLAEFADVKEPERTRASKWVIIISTQFGCQLSCAMCDAGGDYRGNLTKEEMFAQIDHVLETHPEVSLDSVEKFKVQFARMGEPALNAGVLDAVKELPAVYAAPGLIPCVATTAPAAAKEWLNELIKIRKTVYDGKPFQLQFSINSTDKEHRALLMPGKKLDFNFLNSYAREFSRFGPRKVALNFAMTDGIEVDADVIKNFFDPSYVCVKLTPLNPTISARDSGLSSLFSAQVSGRGEDICRKFERLGFETILSIGDEKENLIGSNCGMAVRKMRNAR